MDVRASFIDIEGIRSRCLEAGSGETIVLLHGVGMAADCWIGTMAALSRDFRLLAPDMLGCGFTPLHAPGGQPPPGPPQLAMVAHLSKLFDRIGVDRFAVVGSSLGGLVGALQYLAMPERVAALAFCGSAALYAAAPEKLAEILAGSFKNGSTAYADVSLDSLRRRLANIVHDVAVIPEYVLHMQLTAYSLPWSFAAYSHRMQGMIAALEAGDAGWIRRRLGEIAIPALAIAGDADPRTTPEWESRAARDLPDARQVTFENCGHFPHLEYPARFETLIARFVRGEALE